MEALTLSGFAYPRNARFSSVRDEPAPRINAAMTPLKSSTVRSSGFPEEAQERAFKEHHENTPPSFATLRMDSVDSLKSGLQGREINAQNGWC